MQLVRLGSQSGESKAKESKCTTKAIDSITVGIAKSKRAVVLTGAGCSTTAGIPDFRSKDTGLYSSSSASSSGSSTPTKSSAPPTTTLKGPAMFSASVYSSPSTTSQHLQFLSAFKQSLDHITSDPPTATHGFIGLLNKRGQLRRVYTQNIDNLEARVGLKAVQIEGVRLQGLKEATEKEDVKGKGKEKLEGDYIQLHGSIYRVRCSSCDYVAEWKDEPEVDQCEGVGQVFARGEVAECPQCTNRAAIRAAQRKRSLPSRSFLRPAITLYEENSPAALSIGTLSLSDLTLGGGPDLMIVMGTSLKIPGFKKLVKEFAKAVKSKGGLRILVNREEIKGAEWKDVFDYNVISDLDLFTNRILSDWKRTRPRDWVGPQTTLFDSFASQKKSLASSCTASNKKSDSRPPLRPLSSNTILPPLPSRSFEIVSDNPWSTVKYISSTPPTKRQKPNPSPSPTKPRSTRTSQAALAPLKIPSHLSSSSSPSNLPSPFQASLPYEFTFNTSTPPHQQRLQPYSKSFNQHHQFSAPVPPHVSCSPTKPLHNHLYQPFKPPRPTNSKSLNMILDSRTPSPEPEYRVPISPVY